VSTRAGRARARRHRTSRSGPWNLAASAVTRGGPGGPSRSTGKRSSPGADRAFDRKPAWMWADDPGRWDAVLPSQRRFRRCLWMPLDGRALLDTQEVAGSIPARPTLRSPREPSGGYVVDRKIDSDSWRRGRRPIGGQPRVHQASPDQRAKRGPPTRRCPGVPRMTGPIRAAQRGCRRPRIGRRRTPALHGTAS
jgi:hypothetical protein